MLGMHETIEQWMTTLRFLVSVITTDNELPDGGQAAFCEKAAATGKLGR